MTVEYFTSLVLVFIVMTVVSFLAMSLVLSGPITVAVSVAVGLIAAVSTHREGAGQ